MNEKYKTILLTGNLGFLGSILTEKLLFHGYKVIGFDNCTGRTNDSGILYCNNPNFSFIKGDILDTESVFQAKQKADFVIHMAAQVGEPLGKKHKYYSSMVNSIGTDNVAKIGKNLPIIYSSTGSCYGKIEGICDEESPTNPLSIYGKSKLEGEQWVKNTKNYIIYRFATAYGLSPSLRLDLLPNDLCYQAWKNKVLVIAQPEFRRTFCHCKDICDAIIFGLFNFEIMKNEIYNVGDNKGNLTKKELAELIKEKTQCSIFYDDEIYKDGDQRDYEVSYEKINKCGWFSKIKMSDGLDELLKAMPFISIDSRYYQKI